MYCIVPNYISEAIYAKIDACIKEHPDAELEREELYALLLDYFNEHGVIADIGKKQETKQ